MAAGEQGPLDLQDVLKPLSSLPLLHSLSIEMKSEGPSDQRIIWWRLALLSGLRSLRSLTLRDIPLPAGALSLLCSLPLEHLDLRGVRLGINSQYDADIHWLDLSTPHVANVSFSLRGLQLPDVHTVQAMAGSKQY
jgi:hypothetical protein